MSKKTGRPRGMSKSYRGHFPVLERMVDSDAYRYGVYSELSVDQKLADPAIQLHISRCIQFEVDRSRVKTNNRYAALNDDKAMFWHWFDTSREKLFKRFGMNDKSLRYLSIMYMVGSGRIITGLPGVNQKILKDITGLNYDAWTMKWLRDKGFADKLILTGHWYTITPAGRKVINHLMQVFSHQYRYAEDILLDAEREYQQAFNERVERAVEYRDRYHKKFVEDRRAGKYPARAKRKPKDTDHFPGAQDEQQQDIQELGEI